MHINQDETVLQTFLHHLFIELYALINIVDNFVRAEMVPAVRAIHEDHWIVAESGIGKVAQNFVRSFGQLLRFHLVRPHPLFRVYQMLKYKGAEHMPVLERLVS